MRQPVETRCCWGRARAQGPWKWRGERGQSRGVAAGEGAARQTTCGGRGCCRLQAAAVPHEAAVARLSTSQPAQERRCTALQSTQQADTGLRAASRFRAVGPVLSANEALVAESHQCDSQAARN